MANDNVPEPSVFKNWLALPSDVGKVNPLIVTPPVPLPESSRLKKNTTNSSDAMLTNNIGKKEDKNDRKSLDQMKVSKTTSSILPSNVVSVKPSLSKVSNIANKIDLGNKCFYTIDGINQYRFSLCKKYEVEYNTAFGPPEQQHNTMKDQMYVDIKEQNFWIGS